MMRLVKRWLTSSRVFFPREVYEAGESVLVVFINHRHGISNIPHSLPHTG